MSKKTAPRLALLFAVLTVVQVVLLVRGEVSRAGLGVLVVGLFAALAGSLFRLAQANSTSR